MGGREGHDTDFVGQWTSAVARAAMALYLQKILDINKLSRSGAVQLSADIGTSFVVVWCGCCAMGVGGHRSW